MGGVTIEAMNSFEDYKMNMQRALRKEGAHYVLNFIKT